MEFEYREIFISIFLDTHNDSKNEFMDVFYLENPWGAQLNQLGGGGVLHLYLYNFICQD